MKREKGRVKREKLLGAIISLSSFLIPLFSFFFSHFRPLALLKQGRILFALFTFFPTLYLVYPIAQVHKKNLMPDTLALFGITKLALFGHTKLALFGKTT